MRAMRKADHKRRIKSNQVQNGARMMRQQCCVLDTFEMTASAPAGERGRCKDDNQAGYGGLGARFEASMHALRMRMRCLAIAACAVMSATHAIHETPFVSKNTLWMRLRSYCYFREALSKQEAL